MEQFLYLIAWVVIVWSAIAVSWDMREARQARLGRAYALTAQQHLAHRLASEPHFLLDYANRKVCNDCPRHGPGPREDMINWCHENLKNGFDRIFYREIEVGFRQEVDEKLYLFFANDDEKFMFKMRWL